MTFLYDIQSLSTITIKRHYIQIEHSSRFGKNRNILHCKYVDIMLNVDVNILIDINDFMTSKDLRAMFEQMIRSPQGQRVKGFACKTTNSYIEHRMESLILIS